MSEHKEQLLYWIEERWKIRSLKDQGFSPPWTRDPVLRDNHFCNVMREDDKVTRWIREHFGKHPAKTAPMNMLVARLVNSPRSLEAMGWPFDEWGEFEEELFRNVMSQKGAWGGACIVGTGGHKQSKEVYAQEIISSSAGRLKRLHFSGGLKPAHRALTGIKGIGSFMAAQIIADLKNTDHHQLARAKDWYSWAAHRPGSLRGLGLFVGEPITSSMFTKELMNCKNYLEEKLDLRVPIFCNQDLQHCLCEYDKYVSIKAGGLSKRNYG